LIAGEGLNVLLVVFQAIIAVFCVEFCRLSGLIENYPKLTFATAKSWAPVNIFFCLMLFTGMAALQTNSVPMVTVFKNITNVTTTFGDYIWFGSKPEKLILAAFGVMLGGAVIAAWKDISVTPVGLFWMAMNCIATSGYVLYMKHATQSISLTKFGMVYVNNVLCAVFLFPVALVSGEISLFLNTSAIHTIDYATKNLFAGFVGFFLNFASLSCVQTTGPTTYAIIGSLNKVPVTFLGYFMFDTKISGETWFYIGVSMCGGFLYSYAKIMESRPKGGKPTK
jgi:GDP-mannose transporter